MPLLHKGPLQGFYFPDYDGESILNLVASIIRSRGGQSPHRELRGLDARRLAGARRLVYLIVDGLGEDQLGLHIASGGGARFLGALPHRTISTVFPATTAAAITTLTTGASPAEHGILGWHLHLPDLGMVSTILPATTRTGMPIAGTGFSLRDYLRLPSHVETVPCPTELISQGAIPRSRYSLAGTRWTRRFSFNTLKGLERRILAFARRRGPGLAHAYWPDYDGICHAVGCGGRLASAHLEEIDAFLDRIVSRLRGTGTALVVTADHGLVDARPGCSLELRGIPDLYDCLAVLPSGDARGVHCLVRPARVREFLATVRKHLSRACACVPGKDLLESGAFGPGEPHAALPSRVGDFILLAREGCGFAATPAGFETHFKVGNHGGMSAAEMLVPLWVVGP